MRGADQPCEGGPVGKSGKCRADLAGSGAEGPWRGARMCPGRTGSRCT
jgi:hypothetical protein